MDKYYEKQWGIQDFSSQLPDRGASVPVGRVIAQAP